MSSVVGLILTFKTFWLFDIVAVVDIAVDVAKELNRFRELGRHKRLQKIIF